MTIETRIRENRLLDLPIPWADEVVFPHFDGFSIYNVAQSVLVLLGAEAVAPLDDSVWQGEPPQDVDRVVLVLTDGLGYRLLREWMADDADLRETITGINGGREVIPLTSTAPSTTAVALPTLWTAAPPAVHGMVGTEMFLRRFGMQSNMLRYSPAQGKTPRDAYDDWGMAAEEFVPVPSLPQRLNAVDVPTHLLLATNMINSGLSRIMHRDVAVTHPHSGGTDVWLRLHDVLAATAGRRTYVMAYWPAVDTLSHLYGARSRYVRHEVKTQMTALRDVLASDAVRDGRTLVMILADHGHHDAPERINFSELAAFQEALRMPFGGDERFAYLYLRGSQRQPLLNTLSREYRERLLWIEPETAVHAGLFGQGDTHTELYHRLGDLLLVPRLGTRLLDDTHKGRPVSIHAGLSDWEMLVPFLWSPL